MDIRQIVGQILRQLREAKGLSQEQLAFEANLHRTYVSGIERGIRNPTVVILDRLAAALDVPVVELLAAPGRTEIR
jgi:transcriptional regulator with XRE-family HTH domain